MSVAPSKPSGIVSGREGRQSQSQLLHGGEEPHPKQLLLEHANGALCDPVPLGRAYIGGRTGYSGEIDFLLAIIGHMVGSMKLAQPQPKGPMLSEVAEVSRDPLSEPTKASQRLA